jgi:hypothetical protein
MTWLRASARAFNTLGWENFEDLHFADVVADLFYSATEGDRETMDTLIAAVGLRPQYLGDGQRGRRRRSASCVVRLVVGSEAPTTLGVARSGLSSVVA